MTGAATTRRRGRRQGEPVSRDVVLDAAKRRFAEDGYEKTTLRAIAKDAGVDASMVLYLFGSKDELFRESIRLILDPDLLVTAMAAGEADGIGARLVTVYLQIWENPTSGASMAAMLSSALSNPDASNAFHEFMREYVLTAVSSVIGVGDEARLRALLAATNLIGTAVLRYILKVSPMADLSADEVRTLIAPSVQRYLTADIDEIGVPQRYRP